MRGTATCPSRPARQAAARWLTACSSPPAWRSSARRVPGSGQASGGQTARSPAGPQVGVEAEVRMVASHSICSSAAKPARAPLACSRLRRPAAKTAADRARRCSLSVTPAVAVTSQPSPAGFGSCARTPPPRTRRACSDGRRSRYGGMVFGCASSFSDRRTDRRCASPCRDSLRPMVVVGAGKLADLSANETAPRGTFGRRRGQRGAEEVRVLSHAPTAYQRTVGDLNDGRSVDIS